MKTKLNRNRIKWKTTRKKVELWTGLNFGEKSETFRLLQVTTDIQYWINIWKSKKLFTLDTSQFASRSKNALVDWSKEILNKFDRIIPKHVYDTVTGEDSPITRMSPNINSSRLCKFFKISQIQQKLFAHQAFPSKRLFFKKNWKCQPLHYNLEQSIPSDTQPSYKFEL